MFAIVAVIAGGILIGTGIVVAVLTLFIIFGLITTGVLSVSVMVGLNKKSFMTGFKTFVITCSTVFSALIMALFFFIYNKIVHWWSGEKAALIGICTGLIAGFLLGALLMLIVRRLTEFFKTKLL